MHSLSPSASIIENGRIHHHVYEAVSKHEPKDHIRAASIFIFSEQPSTDLLEEQGMEQKYY